MSCSSQRLANSAVASILEAGRRPDALPSVVYRGAVINSILSKSANELAALIRSGDASAESVVSAHLDRLYAIHPVLNTVLQIAPESAIRQASAVDAAVARRDRLGPLAGVPFTVKDVFPIVDAAELVDMPDMAGRPDRDYKRDATVVARLCAAGAIPIAVTRATLWNDREERYGYARNPYNLDYKPAGSSGGEAATVAACGSALGIGSDSGGSLRDPANRCGIATLRPSNGRVPRGVDADGTNDPRTVAGPLARTVADVALAMSIIGGPDPFDPTTLPMTWPDYERVNLAGMRVLAFDDNGIVTPTDADCEVIRRVADVFDEAGCAVEMRTPDWCQEAYDVTLQYWKGCENTSDHFQFLERWDRMRMRLALEMERFDVIVCPVEPLTTLDTDGLSGASYTAPFSLAGLPAAVVRAGTSPHGIPIGVQLVAGHWRDDVALAAAAQIEAAFGGWQAPRAVERMLMG